jgi:hypothetical protein
MRGKFCKKNKIIARASQKGLAGRVFGTKGKRENHGFFKNFQDF